MVCGSSLERIAHIEFLCPRPKPGKDLGVSKNNGTPKSSILIGFFIIFTIHFEGPPLFLETPIWLVLDLLLFGGTPRSQQQLQCLILKQLWMSVLVATLVGQWSPSRKWRIFHRKQLAYGPNRNGQRWWVICSWTFSFGDFFDWKMPNVVEGFLTSLIRLMEEIRLTIW